MILKLNHNGKTHLLDKSVQRTYNVYYRLNLAGNGHILVPALNFKCVLKPKVKC